MEHLVVPLCRYRLIGRAILVAPGTTSVRFRLSAPYSVTLRPLGLYTCGSNESLPTCCAQIKFPNNTLKWGVGVTITHRKWERLNPATIKSKTVLDLIRL